eukprot:1077322-Alexandrium_andersonii.AAC.1
MVVHVGEQDAPSQLDSGEVVHPGQAMVCPIWWAETATNNLQNRCKEIANEIEAVVANVPRD